MTLNKPNPRLAILRAQLAAEADAIKLQRLRYKMSKAIGCSCPVPAPDADSLPLPPSYWEDLEHWLKTLAPAKPAAPQHVVTRIMCGGVTIYTSDQALAARLAASTSSADGAGLIGFDRSAAPGVAGLMHKVCIREHIGKYGGAWKIGEVVHITYKMGDESAWLPSDEDGWVPHTPTADAVCPVPDGIDFEAKWQDGEVSGLSARSLRTGAAPWRLEGGDVGGLAAWRPIADGSK